MLHGRLEKFEIDIASQLNRIELDQLDAEWIKEVIDNEFLQCQDLPLGYEELLEDVNVNARLANAQKAVLSWLEENKRLNEDDARQNDDRQSMGSSQVSDAGAQASNRGSKFWGFILREEKLNIKSLLALLGYIIDRGSALTSSPEERNKCFTAAKLYLSIICIPGSMAFGVFHQMLYTKALQLIQLYIQVMMCTSFYCVFLKY